MSSDDSQRPFGLPTRGLTALLLAAYAIVVALRLPGALLQGRFYSEEGTFFFAYAWHEGWADGLFHTLGGYLNIVANSATSLAAALVRGGALDLTHAPLVTGWTALAMQLLPAVLILRSRARWLEGKWTRPLALLAMLMIPATQEVWLNSLHSQFHLTLCVALMLATEPPVRGPMRWLRYAILLIAPLAGPTAIVLLPFLALRAVLERSRLRGIEAAILALGAAIQLIGFYSASDVRGEPIPLATLAAAALIRHAVLPLAGPQAAVELVLDHHAAIDSGAWAIPAVLLAGALFGLLAMAAWKAGGDGPWLVIPALALMVVSLLGAIATDEWIVWPLFGQRYLYTPQAMIALGLLAMTRLTWPRTLGKAACGVFALGLAIGLFYYPVAFPGIARGPSWQAEVSAWRADPAHPLAIWPKGETMDLSPGDRSCASELAAPWCHAAWEARTRQQVRTPPDWGD